MPTRALVIVDVQNDFVPGGALPVPGGDEIVPNINRLIELFARRGALICATQDWHPARHISFAGQHPDKSVGDVIEVDGLQQELWPDHCIAGTAGAELVANLERNTIQFVVKKGTNERIDSYSGFFDNGRRTRTILETILKSHGVSQIYLAGLTTEYCVAFTALDARLLGFQTAVIRDATRALNVSPDDADVALNRMQGAGVHLTTAEYLLTERFGD